MVHDAPRPRHRRFRAILAALGAAALAAALGSDVSHAVGTLTVDSNTPPFAVYDHNKPPEQSPGVIAAQAEFCNAGTDPLANVVVHIGDGTTPGTFPNTMFGGNNYSLSMLDAQTGGDVDDATRLVDALAPGACETVYWLLVYPRTGDLTGLELDFTVWGTGLDGMTVRDDTEDDTIELRSDISASANKLNPSTFTLTPSGPFYWGQTVTVCYTNVDFGIIGNGQGGVNNFTHQPVGNLGFNPDFWQLDVVTSSLLSTKCPPGNPEPYDYTDELYYSAVDDGDWTPPTGVEACSGNSQNVTGQYCYTFVAINNGTTTMAPYQEASSGNQEKFNGDYGASPLTLVSNECAISLVKSASPSDATTGETLTYTTNYTNLVAQIVGTPPSMLVITDAIPDDTDYQSGTASCPTGVACTVYYSTNNGTSYSTIEPADETTVTNLRFVMTAAIAASGTGSVRYSVTVNTDDGVTSGRSQSSFDGGPVCSESGIVTTTPVTLAAFRAEHDGRGGARFAWTTASEIGNVGFNLYEVTATGRRRLNDAPIPAGSHDGMSAASYAFHAPRVASSRFELEDVDLRGAARTHGMFVAGVAYGADPSGEAIDWDVVRAEEEGRVASRRADAAADTAQRIAGHVARSEASAGRPAAYAGATKRLAQTAAIEVPVARLSVDADGMMRVTYEDLRAAGIDLAQVDSAQLAVVSRGAPVPVRVVSAGSKFGPGSSITFRGEAADGIYTRTNVYDVVVDAGKRRSYGAVGTAPSQASPPATSYLETLVVDDNLLYGQTSPLEDPWYARRMLVFESPGTWSVPFAVDHVAAGPATLDLSMWGGTAWVGGPDHHVTAALNGVPIVDQRFDGLVALEPTIPLPDGLVREGANVLELTLPGDNGFDFDLVNFDRLELRYPRSLVARDGSLSFELAARSVRVEGLTSANVDVYRFVPGSLPVRYDKVAVARQPDGTYAATFDGYPGYVRYEVLSAPPSGPAAIEPLRAPGDLSLAGVDYVMIAHPSFVTGVERLAKHHRARGLQVKVVDVRDVYDRHSGGVIDPLAIKAYVAEAHAAGVRFALLVGADTYDYLNHVSQAVSFVPTLYARTDPVVRHAPVDPLLADADGDGTPDLAIGRLPVRTGAELDSLIDKTLAYDAKAYGGTAVFAADVLDPDVDFTADSEAFIDGLPAGWSVERAHVDVLGMAAARSRLLGELNAGRALTSYVGHSSPTAWTFGGLLRSGDAATLGNAGRPTVVVQWGCWNTYFVSPLVNALGNAFLLSGDRGAAAVLGATTLTDARAEELLGQRLMPRITAPGATIGEAVLAAKQELAAKNPGLVDVILGWTVLGDPALRIAP